MKKLMCVMVLVLSTSVFSQEKISDVANEASFQENISKEILFLTKVSSKNELVAHITDTCEKVAKKQESEVDQEGINTDCRKKLELVEVIDLETVKDQMISELQEVQSAGMYMFIFSSATGDYLSHGQYVTVLDVLVLPIAVIADIALLPFTFVASLVTGF